MNLNTHTHERTHTCARAWAFYPREAMCMRTQTVVPNGKRAVNTNSQVVLLLIHNNKNITPLAYKIREEVNYLENICWTVFARVRACTGVPGNEDGKRRTPGNNLCYNPEDTFLRSMCKLRAFQPWESLWYETENSRYMKAFFFNIQSRLDSDFKITVKVTQVLSGHGKHLQYLLHFRLAESLSWPSGRTIQNWNHLIYNYPHFDNIMSILILTSLFKWAPAGQWVISRNQQQWNYLKTL